MPAHLMRLLLRALACTLILLSLAAPASARPNVAVVQEFEGDPGDGVLDPARLEGGFVPSGLTADDFDSTISIPMIRIVLPLPGVAGWTVVPVILAAPAANGEPMRIGTLIATGRWQDAR